MPTSPAIHQISHQVSLDPYHLHMPWMNIHFLWVFKEQNVLTEKEIERFQDAVQIDQHLIIWPIAIKGDLEKTIRTNCIYHCSSAKIISQLFCQKNTFHWKQDLSSYLTFSPKCLFIVVYGFCQAQVLVSTGILLFELDTDRWNLVSWTSFWSVSLSNHIYFFTCPQYLFYWSCASLSAALVPVMHRASSSSEEKQEKWHLDLLISDHPPDTQLFTLSRYLQTLSLPGDQYALWCVTIMSGTSWSPWHRIDWGHTMTLLSNERPGMTSEDQSQAASSHLPESPAVSELPWWMLAIVTNADIWCYVLCSSWSEMRNVYQ